MQRRTFLAALPAVTALLSTEIVEAAPQDLEFERAWERAQRLRPRTLASRARIAPAAEPGSPLQIAGRVFGRGGRAPAAGVTVFAYHTDARGFYDERANGPHSWRLKGWARTDAEGRFTFDTIRPAPYPARTTAAHVHFSLERPGAERQWAGLVFGDDPLVSADERATSDKLGRFGQVRPVVTRDGVQLVEAEIMMALL
jgi:protocatechuate 3,4-dioxygenase beta subunit